MASNSTSTTSDDLHLRNLLNGGKSEFQTFYDCYSPCIFGLLLRIFSDKSHAEELLHVVFYNIWQQRSQLVTSVKPIGLELLFMAKNAAFERLKLHDGNFSYTAFELLYLKGLLSEQAAVCLGVSQEAFRKQVRQDLLALRLEKNEVSTMVA